MKVIQLRGTNATGKTTTLKQFMERYEFVEYTISTRKRDVIYRYNKDRKIVILGKYTDCATGGIDGYITNKDELKDIIIRTLKCVKPNVLIFEGIVYGVTFKWAYELNSLLKRLNVDYIGIVFTTPLDVCFERLAQRNGGKNIDYMSVQNKYFTCLRAYEKLKKSGVNMIGVDTTKYRKEDMYKIIEEVI